MKKKNILICFDRDGTIIYDDKYHLGSQKDWKKLVRFRKGVFGGLKLINKKLPHAKIYFISNQSGVAIKELPLLTSQKAVQVCNYVVSLVKKREVKMEKCFVCPHTDEAYKKSHSQFHFEEKVLCNCACNKPKPGMIKSALKAEGWTRANTNIYVVGDRSSDLLTAHNISGYGILVPFINRPGEVGRVRKLKNKKKYVARSFIDACKFVVNRELKNG